MPLNDEQVEVARSWVGEKEPSSALDDRYDRFLADMPGEEDMALYFAVVETLRRQLSKLVSDRPSSASISGMNVSYTQNISTLQARLKELSGEGLKTNRFGVAKLVRKRSR
jgi:hypothetical protein